MLQDSDDEYYFEEKLIFDDDGGQQTGEGDGGLPFLEVDDPGSDGPRVEDDDPNFDGPRVEYSQSDMMVDKKDKKKNKKKKDKKAGKYKKKSVSKDEIPVENPAAPCLANRADHNPVVVSHDDGDEDDNLPLSVLVKRRRTSSPWTMRRERERAGASFR